MKKTNRSRAQQRYDTYLAEREKLISKGYKLETALTKKEHAEYYAKAKLRGLNNIEKVFASQDKLINKTYAKAIKDLSINLSKKFKHDELGIDEEKKYNALKQIFGTDKKGNLKSIKVKNIQSAEYNFSTNHGDAKTAKQALFFQLWDILQSKELAEETYGY